MDRETFRQISKHTMQVKKSMVWSSAFCQDLYYAYLTCYIIKTLKSLLQFV